MEKGETLSSLAQKYYGMSNASLVDLLLDFNPEIADANLIRVNQKIKIPKITEEFLIIQSPDLTYKIHLGTFWKADVPIAYVNEPVLMGKQIEILARRVSPQETWYRVVVGKFRNREEVLKVIGLLKTNGILPLFGGFPKTS